MTPGPAAPCAGFPSGSNFALSFLFLPLHQRRAICAFYSFCRAVDDAVDTAVDNASGAAAIAGWRREIDSMYAGRPQHPIMRDLEPHVRRFGMGRNHLEELVNGADMDLRITRYETFAELEQYAYRVASTVGLVSMSIFERSGPALEEYAINLGKAFQMTNIIRDVRTDAARGRIYIPQEDMRRFGYTETELMNSVYNDNFVRLMEFESQRARSFYGRAGELLTAGDRRALVAPAVMTEIYRALLGKIERAGFMVFGGKIRISAPVKMMLAGRAWLRCKCPRGA